MKEERCRERIKCRKRIKCRERINRKIKQKHKRCKIYENINLAEPVRYSLINFHPKNMKE